MRTICSLRRMRSMRSAVPKPRRRRPWRRCDHAPAPARNPLHGTRADGVSVVRTDGVLWQGFSSWVPKALGVVGERSSDRRLHRYFCSDRTRSERGLADQTTSTKASIFACQTSIAPRWSPPFVGRPRRSKPLKTRTMLNRDAWRHLTHVSVRLALWASGRD